MRSERLLTSVIWLTISTWLVSTIYGLLSNAIQLDATNYFPATAFYLTNLTLILLASLVATLGVIKWTRYETKKHLGEHRIPGAKSSLGPFPQQWERTPIPAQWHPIDRDKFPKFAAYIDGIESLKNANSKDLDPTRSKIIDATFEVMRALNGKPGLPASSRIGAHGDVTLPEHCYQVAESGFEVHGSFHYEGYTPQAKTLKPISPNDPKNHGRALFQEGPLTLEAFILTCLAHDIGKLKTFQTEKPKGTIFTLRKKSQQKYIVKKVIGDHGPVGARLLAKLPKFSALPYSLRSYIYAALSHYHTPDKLPQAIDEHSNYIVKCDPTQALMLALIQADKAACAAEKMTPEDYPESLVYYNPMNHRPLYEAILNSILPGQGTVPYNHAASPNHIGHVHGNAIYVDFKKLYERVINHLDIQAEVATYGSSKDNEIHKAILQLLFAEGILATHFSGKIYPSSKAVFESVVVPPPKMNKEQYELFKKGKPVIFTEDQFEQAKAHRITVKRTIVLQKTAAIFAAHKFNDSPSQVSLAGCVYGEGTAITVEQEENQRTRLKKKKLLEIAFDQAYQADRSEGKKKFDLPAALKKIDEQYPFDVEGDPRIIEERRSQAASEEGSDSSFDSATEKQSPESELPADSQGPKPSATQASKPTPKQGQTKTGKKGHMVTLGAAEAAPGIDNPFSSPQPIKAPKPESAPIAPSQPELVVPVTVEPERDLVTDDGHTTPEEQQHLVNASNDTQPSLSTEIDDYSFLEDEDLFALAPSSQTNEAQPISAPPLEQPVIEDPESVTDSSIDDVEQGRRIPPELLTDSANLTGHAITVEIDAPDDVTQAFAQQQTDADRIQAEASARAFDSFEIGDHSFRSGEDRPSQSARKKGKNKSNVQAPIERSPVSEAVTLSETPAGSFQATTKPTHQQQPKQHTNKNPSVPKQLAQSGAASMFTVPTSSKQPAPAVAIARKPDISSKPIEKAPALPTHQEQALAATPVPTFTDPEPVPKLMETETQAPLSTQQSQPVVKPAMPFLDMSLAPVSPEPQAVAAPTIPFMPKQEELAPVSLRANSLINDDPLEAARANPVAFMVSNREPIFNYVSGLKDKHGFPSFSKMSPQQDGFLVYLTIPVDQIVMPHITELLADKEFCKRLRRTPKTTSQPIYLFLNSEGIECLAVKE